MKGQETAFNMSNLVRSLQGTFLMFAKYFGFLPNGSPLSRCILCVHHLHHYRGPTAAEQLCTKYVTQLHSLVRPSSRKLRRWGKSSPAHEKVGTTSLKIRTTQSCQTRATLGRTCALASLAKRIKKSTTKSSQSAHCVASVLSAMSICWKRTRDWVDDRRTDCGFFLGFRAVCLVHLNFPLRINAWKENQRGKTSVSLWRVSNISK